MLTRWGLRNQVQQAEVQALIAAYKDGITLGKGVQDLHEKGIFIGGEKYFCIKADERSIYGKKVRAHPSSTPPPQVLTSPGQGGHCQRQDKTGDFGRPLPGHRPAWRGS